MFNFQTKRMIKILNNISFPSSALCPGAMHHGLPREYLSPNGKYKAYVTPVYNPQSAKDESEITIKSDKGNILFQKGYFSECNEDGLFVVKAEWSANSRFFVYSMVNPCVHEAWYCPTFFVSTDRLIRKGDRKYFAYSLSNSCKHQHWDFPSFSFPVYGFEVHSLDDRIGTVVNPNFSLSAPDTITTLAISKTIKDRWLFNVSLYDMSKR